MKQRFHSTSLPLFIKQGKYPGDLKRLPPQIQDIGTSRLYKGAARPFWLKEGWKSRLGDRDIDSAMVKVKLLKF